MRQVHRREVVDMRVGAFERTLEGLACHFCFVLDSDAVFVYAGHLRVRDISSGMGLHCFLDLRVLLGCFVFQEEVSFSGFVLSGGQVPVLVHEVVALHQCVCAVVRVVLLIGVQWLDQAAKNLLHLSVHLSSKTLNSRLDAVDSHFESREVRIIVGFPAFLARINDEKLAALAQTVAELLNHFAVLEAKGLETAKHLRPLLGVALNFGQLVPHIVLEGQLLALLIGLRA